MSRDPSYPDRARIDSDVRAFLRPASSPWIVFDRDSRVDDFGKSALRVGAVFASTPSFRPEVLEAAEESGHSAREIASRPTVPVHMNVGDMFRPGGTLASGRSSLLPSNGVFPPDSCAPVSVPEPSNLVVAADVLSEPSVSSASRPRSGRLALTLGALSGLAVAAAIVGLVLAKKPHVDAAAKPSEPAPTATVPAEVVAPPVEEAAATPEAATPPSTVEPPDSPPEPATQPKVEPKKPRFGRLTLKGEAARKTVWFDGKRMLGSGRRTFTVYCGMHTIAVSDKTDSKDVEVPCNGDYVVSK